MLLYVVSVDEDNSYAVKRFFKEEAKATKYASLHEAIGQPATVEIWDTEEELPEAFIRYAVSFNYPVARNSDLFVFSGEPEMHHLEPLTQVATEMQSPQIMFHHTRKDRIVGIAFGKSWKEAEDNFYAAAEAMRQKQV